MNKRAIAVMGAYGATGSMVTKKLLELTDKQIIIAGRNLTKLDNLSQSLGSRVSSQFVEIEQPETLNKLAEQSQIIINCVGPAHFVLDKVAQAAFNHNCHYLDVGGYDILMESLQNRQREIEQKELVFATCAGWIPGLSGVFPRYIAKLAADSFTVESMEIYAGGRDEWSLTAGQDMVWTLFLDTSKISGIYQDGKWVQKNLFSAKKVKLPPPMGKQLALPVFDNQFKKLYQENKYKFFGAYVSEFGWETAKALMFVRMFLNQKSERGAKMIIQAINKETQKYGKSGIVYVIAKGQKNGLDKQMTGTIFTKENYLLHGLVSALSAQAILENKIIAKGVNYLADVVEPIDFMGRVNNNGFQYSIIEK
ncbi:MAG: saccharopine dehydrogenase NADP-binding domain-containing protein [Pleurocapsa sp.]